METRPRSVVDGVMYLTDLVQHTSTRPTPHRQGVLGTKSHKMGPLTTFCCGSEF